MKLFAFFILIISIGAVASDTFNAEKFRQKIAEKREVFLEQLTFAINNPGSHEAGIFEKMLKVRTAPIYSQERGEHIVAATNVLDVDRNDFCEIADKKFTYSPEINFADFGITHGTLYIGFRFANATEPMIRSYLQQHGVAGTARLERAVKKLYDAITARDK